MNFIYCFPIGPDEVIFFFMISLSGLNPQQRSAAETTEGPVLILAGAGSGKTRTLTYRIGHMISNLGLSPKNILGLTFTNKAAKEMKERVIGLLGNSKCRGLTLSTFHSLGVRVLKKEIDKLGYHLNFSIYDSSEQMAIVREALKFYKADKKFDAKVIMSKIGNLKNRGIHEDEFADTPYFEPTDEYDQATEFVFRYYQDKLRFYNAIDFDDILFLVVQLFKNHPEVAKKYSEKYQYIMIDEYQDTNGLQFQLVLALTSTHENLCVVGDDDQSIYSFRGADITNILNFENNFPGAKVVKLEQNYRSVTPILDLANHVIKENKDRREKSLWSDKHTQELPVLWETADTDHEAQIVVEDIVQHQGRGGYLGEVAILYRSNTQAQPIEDELRLSQVPYIIIGGQKFYEKKEIKDLISYLQLLNNPHDQLALRRILNVPNRGIGTETLKKFLARSAETKKSLFEIMENEPSIAGSREGNIRSFVTLIRQKQKTFHNNSLAEGVSTLVEDINFIPFIEKCYDTAKQIDRRKRDISMFIDSAERFEKYHQNTGTLKNFLERLLLQDSQDRKDDEEEDGDVRKNEVTLMTLHSSKGLEFDQVYLIGMEEEILPHKKTITEGGENICEERRLCYVGITRAREKLIMTYCKERKIYGRETPRLKSRFLAPLAKLYTEQDRTTFGHLSEEEADKYKKDFFSNLLENL
jgi:DNA helicase II / ATP-dependent DNA helicase PcrA